MKKPIFVLSTLFILNCFEAFAQSDYKLDDSSCLEKFKKKCSQINISDYESCPYDVTKSLILDNKNRVIGVQLSTDEINEKDGFLVKNKLDVGCAHMSDINTYYFQYKFDELNSRSQFKCQKVLEIVEKIEDVVFGNKGKCTAINPEQNAFEGNCSILGIMDIDPSADNCRQSDNDAMVGFKLEKSDLEGYDLMITETGYRTY